MLGTGEAEPAAAAVAEEEEAAVGAAGDRAGGVAADSGGMLTLIPLDCADASDFELSLIVEVPNSIPTGGYKNKKNYYVVQKFECPAIFAFCESLPRLLSCGAHSIIKSKSYLSK